MLFAVADLTLDYFKKFPNCKVCGDLVVYGNYVVVLAIDECTEYSGVVCEDCCCGRQDVALELFQVNYNLTGWV